MRPIDADALCEYANNQKDKTISANDIMRFPTIQPDAPRVMTLEEVRRANEEPMWFESKGTFRGQKGFWVLSKGVSPSYVIRLIPAIGKDDTELSLAAYGKFWRCWTSRPADEQRKAVKWDG